jgi:hypothetical protein
MIKESAGLGVMSTELKLQQKSQYIIRQSFIERNANHRRKN